jgi:hypothetical protein
VSGAGKTTAARRLLAELRAGSLRCGDRQMLGPRGFGRVAYSVGKMSSFAGNPRPLVQALRAGLSTRPASLSSVRHAMRLAAWSYRLELAAMHDLDLVVLDQGPVQEAWSTVCGATRWDEGDLTAALQAISGGGNARILLVHFDLDTGIAAARIEGRAPGGSRIDRLDGVAQLTVLAEQRRVLDRLVQLAGRTSGVTCYRVDAAQSLDTVCRDVRNAIEHAYVEASEGR